MAAKGRAGWAAAAVVAAAVLAAVAGVDLDLEVPAGGVPGPQECRNQFDAFFLSLDVMGLTSDSGLMSCMAGPTEGCCVSIDRLVGANSLLSGCSCHAEIWDEAWLTVAREAPALNPGSNTGMIEVAKPIVTQRMQQCGLPMPGDPACDAYGNVTSVAPDEAAFPVLNRTGAQFEYSGSYERATLGYDDYGHWHQCNELPDAQYCVVNVQPPGSFMRVRWGVCVPDEVTAQGIQEEIYNTAPDHFDRAAPKADCGVSTRPVPLDAGGWVMTGIFIVFAALVVLATLTGFVCQFQAGKANPSSPAGAPRSYLCDLGLACLMAFDLRSNWTALGREPRKHKSGMDLRSLNGMRCLSMLWIILGHTLTYLIWMLTLGWTARVTNPIMMGSVIKKWYITVFTGGYFAVDTFFFMSGLLVAYLASIEIGKRCQAHRPTGVRYALDEVKFWVMFAVNRFLRLWPLFAAVLFFFWKVAPAMGTSPWWEQSWSAHSEACKKYWWADLLFISNFYPAGESNGLAPATCIGGTWYLAVDMQLYLTVAPLVLMAWHHGFYIKPLQRFRGGLTAVFLAVLMVASIVCAGVLTVKHGVWLQYFGEGNYYHYYVKPWVRAPPYLWGLGAGLMLHWFVYAEGGQATFKSVLAGERIRPWVHALSMATGLSIMAAIIFCTLDYYTAYDIRTQMPPVVTTEGVGWSWGWNVTYNTFKFFAWGGGMFLFSMPMICGHGGGLNRFLGGYMWAPFAKLTFGAYLIHMLYPQMVVTATDNTVWYFQMVSFLGHWMVFTMGSYIIAAVFFLGVEAPFAGIQKALTRPLPSRKRGARVTDHPATDAPLDRPESLDGGGASKHFPARV